MRQPAFEWRAVVSLLFTVLIATGIAKSQTSKIMLAYPAAPLSHTMSALLTSPRGITYRLSLIVDSAPGAAVDDLDLVLHRPGEKATFYGNLLAPTGMSHGIQPYIFGAWDFAKGPRKSLYGQSRVMKLQKLGMEMRVTVTRVRVFPAPGDLARTPEYKFGDLTLEITTRSL
jgi:hypothetical protein